MDFNNNEEIKKSICKVIEGYSYTIHEYGDLTDGYSYLQENDMCITVKNESGKDAIYIDVADELTLSCGAWHEHYNYSDEDYSEMLELIKNYLEGKICTLEVYCYNAGELKWRGSSNLTAEECNLTPADKLIEAFINKKEWPVSGKAIIRFFDENQTVTHEFALGNK